MPSSDDLARLINSGMTKDEIAEKYNVTEASVRKWKRKYKL